MSGIRRYLSPVKQVILRLPVIGPYFTKPTKPKVKAVPKHVARKQGGQEWRAAVIGTGGWGKAQCAVLNALDGVELVAICDRNTDTLASLNENLRPPQVAHYSDFAQMLAENELDFVSIVTNTPSHAPLAEMAIRAGVKRVLVEKPIASSVAESKQLLSLANARGAQLGVNLARRWSPDYQAIKRFIDEGYIGEVKHVSAILGQGGFGMSGIHYLDLMRLFIDSPVAHVTGHLESENASAKWGEAFWDPAGHAMVLYQNGARGVIDISSDLVKRERFFVIRGEYGRIEIDEVAKTWQVVLPTSQKTVFHFHYNHTPIELYHHVARQMLSEATPSCDGLLGEEALATIIAVHLSHRQGHSPIPVPLADEFHQFSVPFP